MVAAPAFLLWLYFCAIGVAASNVRAHHDVPSHQKPEFYKVCIGTNHGLSVPSNRHTHYQNLRDNFTNCTHVDGNLELTWLQNDTLDLSFLNHIREVTGYVLISHVNVSQIVLPRLQIIRGRTLFKINVREEIFALLVTLSSAFTLELPALRDVIQGSVGIYNNYNLCHVKTINWDEIITGVNASYVYVYGFTAPGRDCPRCHSSCEAGCWGEGPKNCQLFSKTNCSPRCAQGRCFGPNDSDCCSTFCAGGCTGPQPSQCLACRNFNDEGTCAQECPPMQIYNPLTYSWEPNPNGKFAYGDTCVRNCPEYLLKDSGACVRSCPLHKTPVNGECVPCNGICPKTCRAEKLIHSGNIESFRDCTSIDGSIDILDMTFTGFQQMNANYSLGERYAKMDPEALEVFSSVREVTGYLKVQAYHPNFTSLSYFRNLEVIGGRQVVGNLFASLYITKTSLQSLDLKSLKTVNYGAIVIMDNKLLCFTEKIAWNKLMKSKDHEAMIKKNGDQRDCGGYATQKSYWECDPQCSADGCWGLGPNQCLFCQNYKFGKTCIQNCSVHPGLYKAESNTCNQCHSECLDGCSGPSQENCVRCKHFRDGPYCVAMCPDSKYATENGTCQTCHHNCSYGCTGPANTVAQGGCNSEKQDVRRDKNFMLSLAPMLRKTSTDKKLDAQREILQGYLDSFIEGFQATAETNLSGSDKSCGRRKINHIELITNGIITKPGDWPWHVAIYRLDKATNKYICGGTLLSKSFVLTAAHCASVRGVPVPPEILSVVLGKYKLVGGDLSTQEREVFEIILHEEFSYEKYFQNDVALLKLKLEATFNDYVQPACLWSSSAQNKLPPGTIFGTVVGWGFDHTDELSAQLKQATIPKISEVTCIKSNPPFFVKTLNDRKFCAGLNNGTSVCNGDSGGGFHVFVPDTSGDTASNSPGAWYVRGVVSLSVKRRGVAICDTSQYALFTDLAKFRGWLSKYFE